MNQIEVIQADITALSVDAIVNAANNFLLVVLAILATLAALISGVSSMAHGGEFNLKHETQFMSARVGLQALTILLLIVALIWS